MFFQVWFLRQCLVDRSILQCCHRMSLQVLHFQVIHLAVFLHSRVSPQSCLRRTQVLFQVFSRQCFHHICLQQMDCLSAAPVLTTLIASPIGVKTIFVLHNCQMVLGVSIHPIVSLAIASNILAGIVVASFVWALHHSGKVAVQASTANRVDATMEPVSHNWLMAKPVTRIVIVSVILVMKFVSLHHQLFQVICQVRVFSQVFRPHLVFYQVGYHLQSHL